MSVSVPADAYAAYARGEISQDELAELEKFADALNKEAGAPMGGLSTAQLGGLMLAAPTAVWAGSKIPQALDNTLSAMTFNRDYNRMLKVNPQLGAPDDPNLRMAFKTLRSTNPSYSKDPLIAGTILDMVMTNRMDPDDPSSAPRFDPALLQQLQNRGSDPAATEAGKAVSRVPQQMMAGFGGGD
jgi:hypothetical protein